MFRKSKALVILLLSICFLMVPMESKASTTEFYLNYPMPSCSDTQGYISLIRQETTTGERDVCTFFWNVFGIKDGTGLVNAVMNIELTSNSITFIPKYLGSSAPYYSIYEWTDVQRLRSRVNNSSNTSYTQSVANGSYGGTFEIIGFLVGGNCGGVSSSVSTNAESFAVNFNDDGSASLLQEQLNLMLDMYAQDSEMLERIVSIMNSNQSIDDKLTQLIELEEENNTWLEKIFNWLEGSPEQEKEAAQTQANQSSSDAQASIEDKSAGFVDSIGSLTNMLNSSSTYAVWTFPALYLPEIPGVMSRTQLTAEIPIDFAYWVNQLPANILLLVRSVCTMALIGYCFKEFYGVIEYVLTLRGGRSNE